MKTAFPGLAAALLAVALTMPAVASPGSFQGRPLDDAELSQVHAAGLNELAGPALSDASRGLFVQPALRALQEQAASVDRQQAALDQLQLASNTLQISGTVMRSIAATGLTTPLAPVMLPVLAIPLPFFMPLPPPKPEKH